MLTEAVRNTQPEPKRLPKTKEIAAKGGLPHTRVQEPRLSHGPFPHHRGRFFCAFWPHAKAAKVSLDGSCRSFA